jgi:hypothetical protein
VEFLRRHLTYANVAATLALFLALGGAAYAATQLPRNSVGTRQLRKGSVTAAKIARRTRNQLRGSRGPAGPQGKTGKAGPKGATGAKGAQGPAGKNGEDGTGPAFEVFGALKPIGATSTSIVATTLGKGAYVFSADVVVESGGAATRVTCKLSAGGEAAASLGPNGVTTLSLSTTGTLNAAGSASLACESPAAATATYANLIATQVKAQTRVGG